MSIYLLEVGTEELPYKFIPQAIEQLNNGFKNFLNDNKVKFNDIKVYATPRRLAVIIDGLDNQTADEVKIVKGPIKNVAYDENGNLTKAGEGFARKNNLNTEDLYIEDNYVHAKIVVKGKSISELLQDNVPTIFMKLQGAHFMRWSNHEVKFSRPIRWVVSILDDKELPIEIIDVKSSRTTRGHRFSTPELEIQSVDSYVEQLKGAHVIVNQDERRALIEKLTKEKADSIGAKAVYSDDLLEEVTYLCEYPVPVVCDFDEKYLSIPDEVTVTVMASHQRYFALYKDEKLLNKFITIANYIGDDFTNIKAGNERVIVARLDDAIFFFNEDTKKPLEAYLENLKGVTFQKGLGSVYDKTQRIVALSKYISEKLDCQSPSIERAALLCKADLTTQLVFEFTELQGYIGADYAKISGEAPEVCEGIKEHYFPLNAESELATSVEGQVVGIADKIDTISAVFLGGKIPTGSSDPLGVRRAALGVIKTVLNKELKLNLSDVIDKNFEILNADKTKEVKDFFIQRLVIYLADSYRKDVLEACSKNKNPLEDVCDYVQRVKLLTSLLQNKEVIESANRISKLVKEVVESVDESLFVLDEEKSLYNAVKSIKRDLAYEDLAKALIEVNPVIVNFFDKVLVMDKDEAIKNNRLGLLSLLKKQYQVIADFAHLQI